VDGFPEYKLVQKRLDALEREMISLRSDVDTLVKDNRSHQSDLDRLVYFLMGDEEMGMPGLVERIKKLETTSAGIRTGQLVIGLIAASTLITLIIQVLQ